MKKQFDTIYINELRISCIVGVFSHERKKKQPLIISVALTVDTKKAGKTDTIADTVSYHELTNEIIYVIEQSSYQLIEKVAQIVADICLKDKRVKQVLVQVEKPHALKQAKSSAIEIIRTNE